jgi:S1-C subfamily serine protease
MIRNLGFAGKIYIHKHYDEIIHLAKILEDSMDLNKTKPDKEFSFIQEKVLPRRRNKVKKVGIAFAITLFLAVIFGLVARIVFIKSEGLINRLLCIDTTKRSEMLFPSEEVENGVASGNAVQVEPTPGGGNSASTSPTVTPTPTITEVVTPTVAPEETVTVIEKKIPADVSDYERILVDIKQIANTVNNCLVTVTSIESKEDWLEEQYEARKSSTGIILGENDAELMILVEYNDVKNANEIEIAFSGGYIVSGELWNYDRDYNLAVIAIKLKDISPLQLSSIKTVEFGESYSLTVGSPIVALGHPNGIAGSMEIGMITSKNSFSYLMDNRLDLFTTDITNNPNSDGVVVNMKGEIVGIISQSVSDNTTVSTEIGISRILPVIEKLVNKYDRLLFGITGEDIPDDVLKGYELENGIYVTKVLQDSPAYNGDVRQGDIITGINEYKVSSITNFASILENYKAEDVISVTVLRMSKGELKETKVDVTLAVKE